MRSFSSSAILLTLTSFAVSAFLPGCINPPEESETYTPPTSAPTGSAPTGIQPGEKLDVFVMEDESFSGKYDVRSTGHVIIPKMGRIKVAGLSASGAEKAISSALESDKLTKATVLVDRPDISKNGARASGIAETEIFISGKVARPGRYQIQGIGNSAPTVHQAVLQAGGLSRFAYASKVHVLRKNSEGALYRIPADLDAIQSGVIKDVPLISGDIVMIPEKKIDFGL